MAVGAVVGGTLVGVGTIAAGDEVSTGATEVDNGVDVDTCEQAMRRTAARMNMMNRL
jgi:hypothetical protein